MNEMDFLTEVYSIFNSLAAIPHPSHYERRVADYLCSYAERLGLEYRRDDRNCVVIRKPATPGHETADPVVLLNHMDMVAVGDGSRPFDPLADGIEPYVENGWMMARGTSLGADNGIGLSMALAVLADNDIVHGPIEVLTTSNEEDGMTGAAGLSEDFIMGRKVINLDSEDYDTITVGSAGAYIQTATLKTECLPASGRYVFFSVGIGNGRGGHSGVDIGKGHINAIHALSVLLYDCCPELLLIRIDGGVASASIASSCTAVVGVPCPYAGEFVDSVLERFESMRHDFADGQELIVNVHEADISEDIAVGNASTLKLIASIPCGVIRMHESMPGTVMTSNNIGLISTTESGISVSCHTRSFSDDEMETVAASITRKFEACGASVKVLMNTPGWQENSDSAFIRMTESVFRDVLGFSPRKTAMHFVLEAGYFVRKFPGVEIACIGPRIVGPHSAAERVELSTVSDICKVLIELLARLA
ncbi:MAG: beta-Ala-His dipeptidase [Bacteroidaceae bacterium]|nr:beta-Ala-His dipeptidase [Bacteroidaceae bacterium]